MFIMNGKSPGEGCSTLALEFIARNKTLVLILMLSFLIYVPNAAIAAGPLSPHVEDKLPVCLDTPTPDPVSQYETLPIHAQLAESLIGSARMSEYLAGYGRPNHLSCQSAHFKYEAFRDDDKISVVSLYKTSGQPHAEYVAVKNDKISGRYLKHGVITAFWPNGKKQFEEYYVDGFAVGFHRYFDEVARLSYVADYSASDYELNKRIDAGELRKFYQGSSAWGNASTSQLSMATRLFRNVYAIENGQAVRKAFATAGLFSPPWIALDLNSTVAQWTSPGNQGTVTIDNRVSDVVNGELDYLPFSDVYLRHKFGLPSVRDPKPYNQEILNYPWIDQAMQLGLEDERFKFKPVTAASPEEIAATPQARYAKCRAQPSTECLFDQISENLSFEQNRRDTYLIEFGLGALAGGYPEWTRKLMTKGLAVTDNPMSLTTEFVKARSLKAQAEWQLGLGQDAQQSVEKAINGEYLGAIDAILPLFLSDMVPSGPEKSLTLYQTAESKRILNAFKVLEVSAIAQARQGAIQEASRLTEVLAPAKDTTAASLSDLQVNKEKQPALFTKIMLALAEGRLERGDTSSTREALGELEKGEPYFLQETTLATRASILYARLGEVGKAMNATPKINHYIPPEMEDIAVAFCKADETQAGKALANSMAKFEKNGKFKKISFITKAKLAKVQFFCGNPQKARTDFISALTEAKNYGCHSDFCDPDRLINDVNLGILATGWLEPIWQRGEREDGLLALKIAVQRAEQGEAQIALERLDDLATNKPSRADIVYPLTYALAKAQILVKLGRDNEAESEFARARHIAISDNHSHIRAYGLLELAKALQRLKQNEKAIRYAKEAFDQLLIDLPSGKVQFAQNSFVNEGIVKLLAQMGAEADALEIARGTLVPEQFAQKSVRGQSRQRVLAEIALAQFQSEANTQLLDAITTVRPLNVRLKDWQRAATIAENREDEDEQNLLQSLVSNELQHLPDSLNIGMTPSERRQAIHVSAVLLQSDNLPLDTAKRLALLDALAETARSTDNQFGTKALCELAYTAQAIQQPSQANAWFQEAKQRASKYFPGNTPISESSLGACAHWTKAAGDTALANEMLVELIKQLPENLDNISHQIHTLLNVAIAHAEYERGEIFWAEFGR